MERQRTEDRAANRLPCHGPIATEMIGWLNNPAQAILGAGRYTCCGSKNSEINHPSFAAAYIANNQS
jgi:hypothetical protein